MLLIARGTAAVVGDVPAPGAPNAGLQTDRVGDALSLEFHSAFWPNLHHVLFAEAWARRRVPAMQSLAGELPSPLTADVTADERGRWDAAVDYYDRELRTKDLLFDDTMAAVRSVLAAASDATDAPPAGLSPEHRGALAAAAPVYREHWWAAHDRANRSWIAATIANVTALAPGVPDRLAGLYHTPWFTAPVRIDVVFVANRQGAYTALEPTHVTISSSDPDNQGWAAAEIVFHETSHALVFPMQRALAREARASGKPIGPMWHVALFYLTGEVVRQALERRGVAYTPYLYQTGLFDRAWPKFKAPIETYWRPYVDGKVQLDEAARQLVAQYQP
jgi:hypothetical protein